VGLLVKLVEDLMKFGVKSGKNKDFVKEELAVNG
jgi:hypothetical protein